MNSIAKPRISIIVAIGASTNATNGGAIGRGNDLIWRISEDLKRFKRITLGHPIIMGRKTYESIGRPLPGRLNIVVTRNPDYEAQGVSTVHSIDEAIDQATKNDRDEIFVIGGGQIYREALSRVDRLYLTLVHSDPPAGKADVFFPDYSEFTKEISSETRESDGLKYTWLTLERP